MRRKTFLCVLLCVTLLPCASLAAALDLQLLTYDAGQSAAAAPLTDVTAQTADVTPMDLWMDATPNMGGISELTSSVYAGEGEELFSGGFQYYRAASKNTEVQQSWYLSLLQALPEIMGYQRSTLRVFRYDDGLYPDSLLTRFGLLNESTSKTQRASLQRDLHLWSSDADASVFTDMVSASPRTFYGTGAAGAARISAVSQLENEAFRSTLAVAQSEALAAQRGETADASAYLCDRSGGQSALMTALENLDTSRLTLIALDTWSLGALETTQDGSAVAPVQQLLTETGLFRDSGLCATVYALRTDYIGSVTSYAFEDAAEALHWGRFLRGSDNVYRECAMPRTLLLLVIGREQKVDEVCGRLETLFASETFAGERGFQDGDGMVVGVNYFYQNIKHERTSFTFAWTRGDIRPAKVQAVTLEEELAFSATLDGGSADLTDTIKLGREKDGTYADHTLEIRVTLSDSAARLGMNPAAAADAAQLTLENSLTLQETLPNTAENRASLADLGIQFIPLRETLYVFRPLSSLDGTALTSSYDPASNQAIFRLALDGDTLAPGWQTYRFTLDVAGNGVSVPAAFAWLTDTGAEGDALDGKWDYEYTHRIPADWLTLPSKIAASGGENRKELVSGMRHAWCVADQNTTLGMVPNIPPVFRLLQAGELTRQMQAAPVCYT